jgi:hypothetical protein
MNVASRMKAGDPRLLTGAVDATVIEKDGKYIAWTKTWEGPARPDFPGACADLSERLALERKSQ